MNDIVGRYKQMVGGKDVIKEYQTRIAKQLGETPIESVSYSEAYRQFKADQFGKSNSLFERLCNWSQKTIKVEVKPADKKKISPYITLGHFNITPEGVYALSYISTLLALLVTVSIGLLLGNLYLIFGGLILSLVLMSVVPEMPKRLFMSWRARASDQLVLAVMYAVIFMEHTPNLELAIRFAAEHLPAPLSMDLMKVLWDVETKKYSTISESLETYLNTWRDWNEEFIEAMHLIESALYQEESRIQPTLDKAVEVVLEGTNEHMLSYAHGLKGPMESLHMLGIVLPVMGLVMLPMVGAFMGESIKAYQLFSLYNFLMPAMVIVIGLSILSTRPAGSTRTDIYLDKQIKTAKPKITIAGKSIAVKPVYLALAMFFLLNLPILLYFTLVIPAMNPLERADVGFSSGAIIMSIIFVLSLGLSAGVYFRHSIKGLYETKKNVDKIEDGFASGIFQLGNRIAEGIPAESAFTSVAEVMKTSPVAELFRTIDSNIRVKGASLREAIFDPEIGAINQFPSGTIKSVMNILVEAAAKGPKIVSRSLITISDYLKSVRKVENRLRDLLAETVSSMSMQVKIFVPVISAIVVGLGALTTTILKNLGAQLTQAGPGVAPGAAAPAGISTEILEIFQIESMIPPYIFQLIVGLYLVETIILLSFLLAGIIHGHDKVEQYNLMSKNIFIGTIFYCAMSAVVVLLFTLLAGTVGRVGV